MKKLWIFLGASEDTDSDAIRIKSHLNSRRKHYAENKQIDVEVISLDDYIDDDENQNERWLEQLGGQDMAVFLFFESIDEILLKQFNRTIEKLKKKPEIRVMTYFRVNGAGAERSPEAIALEERILEMNHYPDYYEHYDTVFAEILCELDDSCLSFMKGQCYVYGEPIEGFTPDCIDAIRNSPAITELKEDLNTIQMLISVCNSSKELQGKLDEDELENKAERKLSEIDMQSKRIQDLIIRLMKEKTDEHSETYRKAKELLRRGQLDKCIELMSADNIAERRKLRNKRSNISDIEEHRLGIQALLIRWDELKTDSDSGKASWKPDELIEEEGAGDCDLYSAMNRFLKPCKKIDKQQEQVLEDIKKHFFHIFNICLNEMPPLELTKRAFEAVQLFFDVYGMRKMPGSNLLSAENKSNIMLSDIDNRLFLPAGAYNLVMCLIDKLRISIFLGSDNETDAENKWNEEELWRARTELRFWVVHELSTCINLERGDNFDCDRWVEKSMREILIKLDSHNAEHDVIYCSVLNELGVRTFRRNDPVKSKSYFLRLIDIRKERFNKANDSSYRGCLKELIDAYLQIIISRIIIRKRSEADKYAKEAEKIFLRAKKKGEHQRHTELKESKDERQANDLLNYVYIQWAEYYWRIASCEALSKKERNELYQKAVGVVNKCKVPDEYVSLEIAKYNNDYASMCAYPKGSTDSPIDMAAAEKVWKNFVKAANITCSLYEEQLLPYYLSSYARSIDNAAKTAISLEKYDKALDYSLVTCEIYKELKERAYYRYVMRYAAILRTAAECYGYLKDYDNARIYLDKSRDELYKLFHPSQADVENTEDLLEYYAIEVSNLGTYSMGFEGLKEQAKEYFTEALDVIMERESPLEERAPLIAFFYSNLHILSPDNPEYSSETVRYAQMAPDDEFCKDVLKENADKKNL